MKSTSILKLFDLSGRVIVLTGSAGLLGTQYAHILSDAGSNVILVDTNKEKNQKLEKELRKKYHTRPMSFDTDITKQSEIRKLVKAVLKKYKKIDALINNAFFNHAIRQSKGGSISLESFPKKIWEQALELNLTGVFLCCQEIGKVMARQRKGVIVNISSIYGIQGADQRIYGKSNLNSPVSYAASKGAIVNLTRYLAAYWHRKNVRVNSLTLGGVEDKSYQKKEFIKNYSEKTILGRMAQKDEYRGAMLFLISDASSYMTGSNLIIDGGWTAW